MSRKIKKIWDIATTVIVATIAIFVLFLVGARLFGLKGYAVLSGSMEPTYNTGAVIFVKQVDPAQLQENDVITFNATDSTVVTHRIIEVVIDNSSISFRTKGDANEIADGSLVDSQDVIGTPVFSIPYLGYVLLYIKSPPGKYVALAVGAGVLLLILLPSLIFSDDKDKTKNKDDDKSNCKPEDNDNDKDEPSD